MTDEANIAPAAPSAAVIDAPTPSTPELGSQTPVADKPEPKPEAKVEAKPAEKTPSKSAEEAVRRAHDAVTAKEAEKAKAAEPKTPAKAEDTQATDKTKVAAKESPAEKPRDEIVQAKTEGNQTSEGRKPHHEAPARFLENAKRDWESAPESVKEEVHRTIKNMEDGLHKHKESADRYEKVREYDELARKNGREGVHESLKQIKEIEDTFQRNPIEGLKRVTDHFGVNLQAVAARIMGENPDQRVHEAHTRIQELEAKIQHMEMAAKAPDLVAEFAAKNERFEELSTVIATLLKNGVAHDLESAYELASALKEPASSAGQKLASSAQTEATASPAQADIPLNPAGQKSVSGAPTGGISPASKRPVPKSNLDALMRASARLG